MRHREPGLGHHLRSVEEQVEVDRAWAEAGAVAHASQRALDLQQAVEQPSRGQIGLHLRHGVQEERLILDPPRLGLADGRQPPRSDQLRCTADAPLSIAEVGAQPDVGAGHGRSTVTAEYSTGVSSRTSGLRTLTRTCRTGKRATSSSATATASNSRSWKRVVSDTSRTQAATAR